MKRFFTSGMLTFLMFVAATISCKTQDRNSAIKTSADSLSYAWGIILADQVKQNGIDKLNSQVVAKALEDMAKEKPVLSKDEAMKFLNDYFMAEMKKKADKNLQEGRDFLETNSKKPGVTTLPSGLQYKVITEGTGPIPTINDVVSTHYHGTLIDGKVFDSSVERGEPVEFPVGQVIKGWTEALQLMKVGSKWQLFIPTELAYGEQVRPGGTIEANMALVFEVELLKIVPAKE